jgi:hypothetical protein
MPINIFHQFFFLKYIYVFLLYSNKLHKVFIIILLSNDIKTTRVLYRLKFNNNYFKFNSNFKSHVIFKRTLKAFFEFGMF